MPQVASVRRHYDCKIISLHDGRQYHGLISTGPDSVVTLVPHGHAYGDPLKRMTDDTLSFRLSDVASIVDCHAEQTPYDIADNLVEDRMEAYGLAYVASVGAVAGLIEGTERIDRRYFDLTLGCRYIGRARRSPTFYVQVKSRRFDVLPTQGTVQIRLDKGAYDELRSQDGTARLLVAVLIPKNLEAWLTVDRASMLLRFRACYANLANLGRYKPVDSQTVTVHLPVHQRLTPRVLTAMIHRYANTGHLHR